MFVALSLGILARFISYLALLVNIQHVVVVVVVARDFSRIWSPDITLRSLRVR